MNSTVTKSGLSLSGCVAEPLMMYLKALGVFRLVAEQCEPDVRAHWEHRGLMLHTALDDEALVEFFLQSYIPTPIVAPWNSRYNSALKSYAPQMKAMLDSMDARLERYRQAIELTRGIEDSDKAVMLAKCRNELPDSVVQWLDAVYVLAGNKPGYPPLLSAGGTVGTSGSGDLSLNHMRNLLMALGLDSGTRRRDPSKPEQWLRSALFAEGSPSLIGGTPGQFNPGGVGGPNATVGFEADSLTNPWDFVLMLEGALLFAGAAARRLSTESKARATFPFTVAASAAGYGTQSDVEYRTAGSRGEIWLPLWPQPATFREVAHVFAEARAQIGMRAAETGSDFARAIAGLGVERGIAEFLRIGFVQRSGKDGIIATRLGRFRVQDNPAVDVLADADAWVRRLRAAARREDAPEGLRRCLRQIDGSVIALTQTHQPSARFASARGLQQVLVALGATERWLAKSKLRARLRPLSGLRADWYVQADDGSAEFRIAAALASMGGPMHRRPGASSAETQAGASEDAAKLRSHGYTLPLRANLEPVALSPKGVLQWLEDSPSQVWQGAHLPDDMAAVISRRCLEARMAGLELAPLGSAVTATPGDVALFLKGQLNERRIANLVLPLSMVRWSPVPEGGHRMAGDVNLLLPVAYAVLKLLFLPWPLKVSRRAEEMNIPLELEVLALLRAGRGTEAYRLACRRLIASGLSPLVREVTVPAGLARRLGAALLIPIPYGSMFTLSRLALAFPESDRTD